MPMMPGSKKKQIVRPGKAPRAKDLQSMLNSMISRLSGGGRATVRHFGDRIIINNQPKNTAKIEPFKTLEVVTAYRDYLKCSIDSDAVSPIYIYVMKPYLLRETPFDGEAVNGVIYDYDDEDVGVRVASAGEEEETQLITPSYFATEQILAVRRSGFEVVDDEENEGEELKIYYEDLNTAGRCWGVEV